MSYAPHGRHYRPVTQSDIDSATRGLELRQLSVEELTELIAHHGTADTFASCVIFQAAQRVRDELYRERWPGQAKPPFSRHDWLAAARHYDQKSEEAFYLRQVWGANVEWKPIPRFWLKLAEQAVEKIGGQS